ncbi:MAG: lycopene cyclase domain-containing protein [Acidimicrobiales bacterium]
MDHVQYLLLMAGCVVVTLPLEVVCGARVWRRPRRLAAAVLPAVVAFSLWDVAAIGARWWHYARRYVSGVDLPGRLPVEEVVFFVVVPVCALLTFEVVSAALAAPAGTPWSRRLVWARTGRKSSHLAGERSAAGGRP